MTRKHGHLEKFSAWTFTKREQAKTESTSVPNVLNGNLFLLINGWNPANAIRVKPFVKMLCTFHRCIRCLSSEDSLKVWKQW